MFTRPEISLKNMKMREREGKEGRRRADCYAALVSFGGANRRGRLPHLAIMQRTRGLKSDKIQRLSHVGFCCFRHVNMLAMLDVRDSLVRVEMVTATHY